MAFNDDYYVNGPRLTIPENIDAVIMMTADRRYWIDPVWRRNVNEFMRYFQTLRTHLSEREILEGDFM